MLAVEDAAPQHVEESRLVVIAAVPREPERAARLLRFHPDLGVSVSPCGVDCAEFRPAAEPPPAAVELEIVASEEAWRNPTAAVLAAVKRRGMTPEEFRARVRRWLERKGE